MPLSKKMRKLSFLPTLISLRVLSKLKVSFSTAGIISLTIVFTASVAFSEVVQTVSFKGLFWYCVNSPETSFVQEVHPLIANPASKINPMYDVCFMFV